MEFTNFTNRIILKNLDHYDPTKKGGGRQFSSSVKPVLPSTRTYSSAKEAIANNSSKYRNKQGAFSYIKVVEQVPPKQGQQGIYRLGLDGTAESKGTPKLAVNSNRPARQRAAVASTSADVDLKISAIKYQSINDKNKQAHHVLEIIEHGGAFEGRSPESKEYIIKQLNKNGFFPGDDRRNYTALVGNKMFMADGSLLPTGELDQHQGYVHSNQSVASEIQKMLPNKEEFSRMTDDQVVAALMPSASAARLDVQNATGVSQKAIEKTESKLRRATAKAVAQRRLKKQ